MKMNGFIARLPHIALMAGAFGASGAAIADVVSLRAAASVPADAPIRIADIATLEGPEAEALAEVVLIENPAERFVGRNWCEVTLDDIRDAVAPEKPNWGRLALTGRACVVRLASLPAPKESQTSAYRKPAPETVDLSGPPTVRSHVASTLAAFFRAQPENLRLLFDDRQAELLNRQTVGLRIETKPTSMSRRAPVRVRLYKGNRVLVDELVRVDAEVRRTLVAAARDIGRGAAIGADDITVEDRWVDPGLAIVTDPDEVIGLKSRSRIDGGAPISPDRIEKPIIVRRGELITIRCLSGGIALSAKARASRDAREGETIELHLTGSNKTFSARIDAAGLAVVDLDAPQ